MLVDETDWGGCSDSATHTKVDKRQKGEDEVRPKEEEPFRPAVCSHSIRYLFPCTKGEVDQESASTPSVLESLSLKTRYIRPSSEDLYGG